MKKFLFLSVLLTSFLPVLSIAQTESKKELLSQVRNYRQAHEHEIIHEFLDLLALPNVSNDKAGLEANAEHIKGMMEKRGIETRIYETPGNPIILGELNAPGATQTLLFYIHYDGQPVDPSKWTDSEPFTPVLRPGKLEPAASEPKPVPLPPKGEPFDKDWRIYARSASDDKGPLVPLLTAIDVLSHVGIPLTNNLKFILDGEEEAGSPSLQLFCETHRDRLKADVLFICDGPVYYWGEPTLWFGVRGNTSMDITVYGPNTTLHSGHYGNWAPNPAMRLVQLLATMKDADGRVTIEGFYDTVEPLSEREKEALAAVPPYDEELMDLYGFSRPEGGGMSLLEAILLPSFNLRGIQTRFVGTAIPDQAMARVGMRLVKGNEPEAMHQKVIEHIQKQGYHVVGEDPDHQTRMKYPLIAKVIGGEGYKASRTSMDLPISKRTIDVLSGYFESDPVLIPSMGASISMYIFTDILDMPVIFLPVVNHDNNQHGPNENVRIGHLWTAIETFAAVMTMGDGN